MRESQSTLYKLMSMFWRMLQLLIYMDMFFNYNINVYRQNLYSFMERVFA